MLREWTGTAILPAEAGFHVAASQKKQEEATWAQAEPIGAQQFHAAGLGRLCSDQMWDS